MFNVKFVTLFIFWRFSLGILKDESGWTLEVRITLEILRGENC